MFDQRLNHRDSARYVRVNRSRATLIKCTLIRGGTVSARIALLPQAGPPSRAVTGPRSKVYRGEAQLFEQRGVVIELFYALNFKSKKRRNIMRLVILASAATLVFTGAAMATESIRTHHHHHHHLDANASIPEGAAPADVLGNHEVYIKNLHDSGYNPAKDYDTGGNIRAN
jgi:hypothetical protein